MKTNAYPNPGIGLLLVLAVLVAAPTLGQKAFGAKPKYVSQEQKFRESEKNLEDVGQRVLRIIGPHLNSAEGLTPNSRFIAKADAKQLETIRTGLEKEFEILLSPTAIRKAETVREVSRHILLMRVVQPWVMMRARQYIDASSTPESALTYKKASHEDHMRTLLERDFRIKIDPRQFKDFKNLAELVEYVSVAFSERLQREPVSLFDGKSLNGWQRQGSIAEFRVEYGMIIGKTVRNAKNTFLCTTKHYADFELTFEVKFLGKPVNSGCQIRSLVREKDGDKNYMKKGTVYGPQVEIEASGPKGSESGNIYGQGLGTDFLKPKKGRVKAIKDNEWNHIRILAEGPHIRTWINREPIIDLTNRDIYTEHSSGMIGLQVHGVKNFTEPQEIAWRNIRITELETSGTKRATVPKKRGSASHDSPTIEAGTISLFDGTTFNGWVTLDGKPVTSGWEVIDGAIHVKIGKEPSGHIKTTRTFENFDLEFEWRVAEGGNSGVKYLTKESDSDRGRGYYGCEYQLLDDTKHKNGRTPTKTAGSLYDLYAPDSDQKHLKPIGEFNHSRIVVDNGRIEHWLNGKKIVEATIGSEDWQARFKQSKVSSVKDFAIGPGVILLQEHLSEAWFRNIRITPLPRKKSLDNRAK